MILAGFCRNCLADWYREAAAVEGAALDKSAAHDLFYGEPFSEAPARSECRATGGVCGGSGAQ